MTMAHVLIYGVLQGGSRPQVLPVSSHPNWRSLNDYTLVNE